MGLPATPPSNETGTAGILSGKSFSRRRSARQAAFSLLAGAAVFVALLFVVAVAFELWFPTAIDPDYARRLHHVREGRRADPEHTRTVVMFGSSRTYYALRAEALDAPLSRAVGKPVSVVNFGFTGAGPVTELLTWRRLQRDGIRPDLVLIEVLPAFLSSTFPVDELSEAQTPTNRLSWIDLATLERYGAGRKRPRLRRDFMQDAAVMLFSHRLEIMDAVAPRLVYAGKPEEHLIERLAPGPLPDPLTADVRRKMFDFARTGYTPILRDFQIGGRGCDALRELLASCRSAGVPAALVLMPEGPEFRSWYPAEKWRVIENWLQAVVHEEHITLVNAREWIDEDDFADSHHLLPAGAGKFTERIGRETIGPLLRRRPEEGIPRTDQHQARPGPEGRAMPWR